MELKIWEELVGRLTGVKINDDETLTLTIVAHGQVMEVKVLRNTADFNELIHHKIGVVKTDDFKRPYLVRRIK